MDPTRPKEAGEGTPKVWQTAEPSLGAAGCVSQLWTTSGEAREGKLGPSRKLDGGPLGIEKRYRRLACRASKLGWALGGDLRVMTKRDFSLKCRLEMMVSNLV